jgi:hypothetical protein
MIRNLFQLFFLLISFQFFGQVYPVQITPIFNTPYSSRVSDYATSMDVKMQLLINPSDISITNRQVRLKMYLQGNNINAQSTDYVSGINPIYINGGELLTLTNLDIAALFRLENLQGISPAQYANALPEGMYNVCFEMYDYLTNQRISQKSCAYLYLMLNDPPLLNTPAKNESIAESDFPNILFTWTPRQLNATNVSYQFEIKEILDPTIDTQIGFLTSPTLYEETLYSTALLYDISKPNLIAGKRYAWRVRAMSTSGLSLNNVFKNEGYSEIFHFTYASHCPAPTFILSEALSARSVRISWLGDNSHTKYHIQYKKANVSGAEWFEVYTLNTQTTLSDLEAGVTYEFRVGGSCEPAVLGTTASFTYSGINQFSMPAAGTTNATFTCGLNPAVAIANQTPINNLIVSETFTAGDFPVKILELSGNNPYTGKGYIIVPYLADTKIAVIFNNITINTNYQLINGIVETSYNPDAPNIIDLEDLTGGNNGEIVTQTVPFEITSVTINPNGDIIVSGPNGEQITIPGGSNTVITGTTATGGTGAVYNVDSQGNVTGPFTPAPGGATTPQNTDGVSASGLTTEFTAQGITVTFEPTTTTKYSWDVVPDTAPSYIKDKYAKVGSAYLPYKAVVNGQSDVLKAKFTLTDTSIVLDSIVFKTQHGILIDKVKQGNDYILTLKGTKTYAEEEVQAVIKQGDKYKVAGAFKLVHLSEKLVTITLVPLNSTNSIPATAITNLEAVYAKVGVKLTVKTAPVLTYDGGGDNKITTSDSDIFDYYTDEEKAINAQLKALPNYDPKTYYLIYSNLPSDKGIEGFMALGGQFGYVFPNASNKTAAHELAHGVFALQHPFSTDGDKGKTPFLMDYGTGTELWHNDWAQINNPALKYYGFQSSGDGEQISDKLLANRFIESLKVFSIYKGEPSYNVNQNDITGSDSFYDEKTKKYIKEAYLNEVIVHATKFSPTEIKQESITTTDNDNLKLYVKIDSSNSSYSGVQLIDELISNQFTSLDGTEKRFFFQYEGTISEEDKTKLKSNILATPTAKGILINMPVSSYTIFKNGILDFHSNFNRKNNWLNILSTAIKNKDIDNLKKYPASALLLVDVESRKLLFDEFTKEYINKTFMLSDLDEEIIYVTLLNSLITDQDAQQNSKLLNDVFNNADNIYSSIDDIDIKLSLRKNIRRLVSKADNNVVFDNFKKLVCCNNLMRNLFADFLLGIDKKQDIALKTSVLNYLNNSGKFIADVFSKTKIKDDDFIKSINILYKWSCEIYNDNYLTISSLSNQQIPLSTPVVENTSINNSVNRFFQTDNLSIYYTGVTNISSNGKNFDFYDAINSQTITTTVNDCVVVTRISDTNNNNNEYVYNNNYKIGKPFSDFINLKFEDDFNNFDFKKNDVVTVPLIYANYIQYLIDEQKSDATFRCALGGLVLVTAPFTGGGSVVVYGSMFFGAGNMVIALNENSIKGLEGGEECINAFDTAELLFSVGVIGKTIGAGNLSNYTFDATKFKNYIQDSYNYVKLQNISTKLKSLEKLFYKFGNKITNFDAKKLKEILLNVDLAKSCKNFKTYVKNTTVATIFRANLEYEIGSLKYLDELNKEGLFFSTINGTKVTTVTNSFTILAKADDVYINVNGLVSKKNLTFYTNAEGKLFYLVEEVVSGAGRHPNWVEVLDVTQKVEGLTPHVLKVETNVSGAFIPKSKTIGITTFNMEGFKGCHTENALKDYVQANGGAYIVKNKSVGVGGVYEGQPVIYLNNKEYVKINGQFVEYEVGKLGGTSSFFPENWTNVKIKEEVEFAIANNHGKVNPDDLNDNLHFGYSKDGSVEIQFYYNSDGSIGSYFPKKR